MIRYKRVPKDDAPLRSRLEELAAERRRFGYRRLAVLLRRDGWQVKSSEFYVSTARLICKFATA